MLENLLGAFLESHKGLSDRARLSIRFDVLVRRDALRSANSGWRSYPVSVEASLGPGGFKVELGTEVVYSSTCPASAALSRQLIQEQFARDFAADRPLDHAAVLAWLGSDQGIVATPHAQRSVARLLVRLKEGMPFNLLDTLDRVEQALGTPVQTAVKREDEQAFALANGGNLMFCEDAARRIQRALDADERLADFHVRVEHQESLHPHDAVAYASKGVPGGFGSP
jgi:GTP cyclohydrolase I